MSEELAHAKLSPSASSRWLKCTASVVLEADYEDTNSDVSVRGTNIHSLAEMLHKKMNVNVVDFDYDDEMLQEAKNFNTYCNDIKGETLMEKAELRVSIPIGNNSFGTIDYVAIKKHKGKTVLHVVDLKTGRIEVDAKDNSQLSLYALGVISTFEQYSIDKVVLHIVQDNSQVHNTNSVKMSLKKLKEFKKFAIKQAEESCSNKSIMVVGDHCNYCKHKVNCTTALAYFAQFDLDNLNEELQIKLIQNKLNFTNYIKDIEAKFQERLEAGEVIKGLKLVKKRSITKWSDEKKVKKEFGRLLPKSELYVKKIISPSQLKSKLKLNLKSADQTLVAKVNNLTTKISNGMTVVGESDRRVAVQPLLLVDEEIETNIEG